MPDGELVADIRMLIAALPTYGYCGSMPCCAARPRKPTRSAQFQAGVPRHEGARDAAPAGRERREERRQDGRVAVDQRKICWCSDGLEIACYSGEKVRVALELDCCDREAMRHVATTAGITAQDLQDLIVVTVEHRYGWVNRVPEPIEWQTDNGSCYTAPDTRDIELVPRSTLVSSPKSTGMAEAFVRTLMRDYVRVNSRCDVRTVTAQLPAWPDRENKVHPHRAFGYR